MSDAPARRDRDPECLFCRIASGEIPATRVDVEGGEGGEGGEGASDVIAFRDINPQAPVHVLVISREHIPSAAELHAGDGPMLGRLIELANRIAVREGVREGGYRLVTNVGADAGQSVAHLHVHLLGGRRMTWPPG